VITQKSR